jgi:hypothetical protein
MKAKGGDKIDHFHAGLARKRHALVDSHRTPLRLHRDSAAIGDPVATEPALRPVEVPGRGDCRARDLVAEVVFNRSATFLRLSLTRSVEAVAEDREVMSAAILAASIPAHLPRRGNSGRKSHR